ncbi:MAG TPA: 8-oxoguanine deaminase [Candidatus Limiplasma sp.]|nr:8-oxoguanine deaminase [Candidatus Limiplasma sp.]HPS81841.1 8-oxoguanine deaminase [Candidatus Limiplasma sp.]
MPKSLLFKNIRHLVTCDHQDRVLEHVNLLIENGVITAIGVEAQTADRVIDASRMAVYPGLINTHHHLYQILTRNLPQVQNLELFDWLTALYGLWENLTEAGVYHSSLAGMGELALHGCTTVFDHHYVFPHAGGDLIAAQFQAADEIGVRMVASRGSMSLSQKDGGLPPDSVVQTVDEILTDSQRLVETWHDPKPFAMRQMVLAPCSPFSVTEDLMRQTALLARSLGVRLHTHLAETRDEERFVLSKTGMRPLAYMESLGWLGSDVWFAHGIHFTVDELRLMAQAGTGVAHCPASNMKLASGAALLPDMLALHVPVGLAVDGSASNDGSNLMEEMRIAYLLHRHTFAAKAPSGYEILKIATRGGAEVLGRPEIGHIGVGMAGDLFAVRENRLSLAGATADVGSMLATVGLGGPVDYTVVGGRVIVEDGRLTGADEERLTEWVDTDAKRLREMN